MIEAAAPAGTITQAFSWLPPPQARPARLFGAAADLARGATRPRPSGSGAAGAGLRTAPAIAIPSVNGRRGRDRHYWRPPAQIPASGIPALGSCHGYLAANRTSGQG